MRIMLSIIFIVVNFEEIKKFKISEEKVVKVKIKIVLRA